MVKKIFPQLQSSGSGNPIDSFHPLLVALKNRYKVKNIVAKAGKPRV